MRTIIWKVLNICLLVCLLGLTNSLFAQIDSTRFAKQKLVPRSLFGGVSADSSSHLPDSAKFFSGAKDLADTLSKFADSSAAPVPDSLKLIPLSKDAITTIVHYKASDSISFDINKRKAQLYSKGQIEYESMELKADDIRVDFNTQMLTACPVLDSAGKPLTMSPRKASLRVSSPSRAMAFSMVLVSRK